MKKMNRRIAAGLAAATLSLTMVACSQAEDAANEATDAAGSVANEATSAVDSAINEVESEVEGTDTEDSDNAEGENAEEATDVAADGETTTLNTPAGDFEVPAAFATAIEGKVAEWGDVVNVDTTDLGSVAEFSNGDMLAWAKDAAGEVPIVGKIAETWKNEGGIEALGMPTGPETTEGTGWVQEFAEGSISWLQGEDGQYGPTIN